MLNQKKQMTFLPIPDAVGDEGVTEKQTDLVATDDEVIGENVLQTKLTKTNLEKKLKSVGSGQFRIRLSKYVIVQA